MGRAGKPRHAVVRCGRTRESTGAARLAARPAVGKGARLQSSPEAARQVVHMPYAVHKPLVGAVHVCSSPLSSKRQRTAIVSRMIGSKGRDSTIRMAVFRGWLPGARQKSEAPVYTLPLLLPITVACLQARAASNSSFAVHSGGTPRGNGPRGRAPGAAGSRSRDGDRLRSRGRQTTLPFLLPFKHLSTAFSSKSGPLCGVGRL